MKKPDNIILENNQKISLPVIAHFVKLVKNDHNQDKIIYKVVNSEFYQTSHMKCFVFSKPLYLNHD